MAKKIVGKVPLNIDLPVPVKEALVKLAEEKGVTMTKLITQWVIENAPEVESEIK